MKIARRAGDECGVLFRPKQRSVARDRRSGSDQTGSLGITSGHKGLTHLLRAQELWRVLVDTDETHHAGITRVRIGVVRHPMAAHALCELQFLC